MAAREVNVVRHAFTDRLYLLYASDHGAAGVRRYEATLFADKELCFQFAFDGMYLL